MKFIPADFEILVHLSMMLINFIIIVLWIRTLFKDLSNAGVRKEDYSLRHLYFLFYGRSGNDVKAVVYKFYLKLAILLIITIPIRLLIV